MSGKILVAYATRYGATREIAEAIGEALRAEGREVDVLAAREVRSLAEYGGVALGGPLYMFHWHRDAVNFLKKHQKALAGIPVAVFAGGSWNDKAEEWVEVRKQIDSELAKFPWLKPAAVQVMGGRFDPALLTFPHSLIPGMKSLPASDVRDWNAIHEWAVGLASVL